MSPAVIQSKLAVPPLGERLAARPRVSGLVADVMARHPLVLVTATAGAGKTTAVVQAVAEGDRPVAWLTLDDTDAAPGRLLTYLEAALARRAPAAEGVATGAMATRIPHAEAAGLLAEACAGVPLLLVVDGLERLAAHETALAVIGALVRYAPATLGIALLSRVEVPLELGERGGLGDVATIGEASLAFTPEEAADALARAGREGVDPVRAVADTGGWVTGVLFEAWRSADHVQGVGGEADPLHGYLSSQILTRLEDAERELLEVTALLDEVTAERAEALGVAGAGELLVRIRAKHLPVAWEQDRRCMRPHPRFREYLLERLGRRPASDVRALHRAHGELLLAEEHWEEAAGELLRAGAPERALPAAERAVRSVVERLDFALAEEWLRALAPVAAASDALTSAELMLAISLEDFRRGAAVADRLGGARERLAHASPMSGSMMAWCLWHVGRIEEALELIALTPRSPEADIVRYLLRLVRHEPEGEPEPPPAPSGGPLDALIMRVNYAHGRLADVHDAPASSWMAAVDAPWRIGALRAMGRTREALELYRATPPDAWSPAWTHGIVGAELMIDLGDVDRAREVLARGRALIQQTGSIVFGMLNRLIEAKLELRLARDPAAALAILDDIERRGEARRYDFIAEQLETWRGLALLMSAPDADATEPLTRAVASMELSGRILELPTAAVLLAEARWRRGDEDGADRAADLAVDAAGRQGSDHHLLLALADFPSVVARRLDAEAGSDSRWHAIGRALMRRGTTLDARVATPVRVVDLGRPAIVVDGREVRPRIAKSVALLAYLAGAPDHEAERVELLGALFDGRADDSARAYLRQAVHRLREVLPDGAGPAFEGSRLRFSAPVALSGEAARAEALLADASRLQGAERLDLLLQALTVLDRGEYLEGIEAPWAVERRRQLAELRTDARLDAGRLAYEDGRLPAAGELARAVLEDDPYRESAWRLAMRVAGAVGDEDGVIAAFRRCSDALGELGARPSDSTQLLLSHLRR